MLAGTGEQNHRSPRLEKSNSPARALLGVANEDRPALGLAVGAGIGVLFGLVFAGVKGRWSEFIYGPIDPDAPEHLQ